MKNKENQDMSNDNDVLNIEGNEVDLDQDDLAELANKMKLRPSLTSTNTTNMNKELQHSEIYTKPVLNRLNQEKQTNQSKIDDKEEDDDTNTNCNSDTESEDDDEEEEEEEDGGGEEDGENDDNNSVRSGISNETEKMDMLMKLDDLRSRGHVIRDFDLTSKLLDMKKETFRIQRMMEIKASLKFQQKMLIAVVSAIEYGNKTFDPFGIDLNGWSENVFENVEDFNNVFERLYEKYRKRGEMLPEIELMLTLAGSAFMFHMSNQLFKSVSLPQGQMRQLRQTVRSAFNNSQQSQQASSQQNQPTQTQTQTQTQLPSFNELPNFLSSLMGNRSSTVPMPPVAPVSSTPVVNESIPNEMRTAQLETLLKSENDQHVDFDRFSIASSSCSEKIREPLIKNYTPVQNNKTTKKKTSRRTNVGNQRTIII